MASLYDKPIVTDIPVGPQISPYAIPSDIIAPGMESQQKRSDAADKFVTDTKASLLAVPTRPTEGGYADREFLNNLYTSYQEQVDTYMNSLEGKWDVDPTELERIANETLVPMKAHMDAISANYDSWLAYDKLKKELEASGEALYFKGHDEILKAPTVGTKGTPELLSTEALQKRMDWYTKASSFFDNIKNDQYIQTIYSEEKEDSFGSWYDKTIRTIDNNDRETIINGRVVTRDKIQEVIDRHFGMYLQTSEGTQHYRYEYEKMLEEVARDNPYADESELYAIAKEKTIAKMQEDFSAIGEKFGERKESNMGDRSAIKPPSTSSKKSSSGDEGPAVRGGISYETKATHFGLGNDSADEFHTTLDRMRQEYIPYKNTNYNAAYNEINNINEYKYRLTQVGGISDSDLPSKDGSEILIRHGENTAGLLQKLDQDRAVNRSVVDIPEEKMEDYMQYYESQVLGRTMTDAEKLQLTTFGKASAFSLKETPTGDFEILVDKWVLENADESTVAKAKEFLSDHDEDLLYYKGHINHLRKMIDGYLQTEAEARSVSGFTEDYADRWTNMELKRWGRNGRFTAMLPKETLVPLNPRAVRHNELIRSFKVDELSREFHTNPQMAIYKTKLMEDWESKMKTDLYWFPKEYRQSEGIRVESDSYANAASDIDLLKQMGVMNQEGNITIPYGQGDGQQTLIKDVTNDEILPKDNLVRIGDKTYYVNPDLIRTRKSFEELMRSKPVPKDSTEAKLRMEKLEGAVSGNQQEINIPEKGTLEYAKMREKLLVYNTKYQDYNRLLTEVGQVRTGSDLHLSFADIGSKEDYITKAVKEAVISKVQDESGIVYRKIFGNESKNTGEDEFMLNKLLKNLYDKNRKENELFSEFVSRAVKPTGIRMDRHDGAVIDLVVDTEQDGVMNLEMRNINIPSEGLGMLGLNTYRLEVYNQMSRSLKQNKGLWGEIKTPDGGNSTIFHVRQSDGLTEAERRGTYYVYLNDGSTKSFNNAKEVMDFHFEHKMSRPFYGLAKVNEAITWFKTKPVEAIGKFPKFKEKFGSKPEAILEYLFDQRKDLLEQLNGRRYSYEPTKMREDVEKDSQLKLTNIDQDAFEREVLAKFGDEPRIAARYNNPFNLKGIPRKDENGDVYYSLPTYAANLGEGGNSFSSEDEDGGGIIKFPTVENGLQAGFNFIDRLYSGESNVYGPNMTIKDFKDTYSKNGWDKGSFKEIITRLMPDITAETTISQIKPEILIQAILESEDNKVFDILKNGDIKLRNN